MSPAPRPSSSTPASAPTPTWRSMAWTYPTPAYPAASWSAGVDRGITSMGHRVAHLAADVAALLIILELGHVGRRVASVLLEILLQNSQVSGLEGITFEYRLSWYWFFHWSAFIHNIQRINHTYSFRIRVYYIFISTVNHVQLTLHWLLCLECCK